MKKLLIFAVGLFIFVGVQSATAQEAHYMFGIKYGYIIPQDDLKAYNNDLVGGITFTIGTIIPFFSLMTSIDSFTLENKSSTINQSQIEVLGLHLDALIRISPVLMIGFMPYLGAGIAYNTFIDDRKGADPGADFFAGMLIPIGTYLFATCEGRYKVLEFNEKMRTAEVTAGICFIIP